MRFTLEEIKSVIAKKDYQFFDRDQKPFNLNIIGIRSNNEIANSFDDWLYLIYKDGDGVMQIHEYPITTDPGVYWLKNPMSVHGTAVLVPDQYKKAYKIGLHQGKYEALRQKRPVKVWRDSTKDTKLDKEVRIIEGIFGINIHRSNASGQSTRVEKWSAGCQVFQKVADFNFFMEQCRRSKDLYGNSFTYTLLEEYNFCE